MFTRRRFLITGIKTGIALGTIGMNNSVEAVMAKSGLFKRGSSRTSNTTFGSSVENDKKAESKLPQLPTILDSLIVSPIGKKIPGIPPGIKNAGKQYEQAWAVRDEPQKLIQFITMFDYKNEPASYLIAGYIYSNPWEISTSTESWAGNLNTNDPMVYFAYEIGEYLNKQFRDQGIEMSKIEEPAFHSMQLSSNQTIQELLDGKLDIFSIEQRDLKILSWATTWLINLYCYDEKKYWPYYIVESTIRNKYPELNVRRKKGDDKNLYHKRDGEIKI